MFDIIWLKNDNNVVSDNRVSIETVENESSLIVSDAEENDTGEYVCKVSNAKVRHVVEIHGKSKQFLIKTDIYFQLSQRLLQSQGMSLLEKEKM